MSQWENGISRLKICVLTDTQNISYNIYHPSCFCVHTAEGTQRQVMSSPACTLGGWQLHTTFQLSIEM